MINVNEYFEGSVKSLAYTSAEGKSTIGVIEPGEYEFGTSQHETMKIIEGELHALLPGDDETWQIYTNGNSFEIAAGKSFRVKADKQVSYLCKYR
ncbi:pyrimidine/purine nucleoside phosphorylase [Mucilaginibacter sp. UR6-1]|uniref:pyrimidine/purine nucleoside phosphorylase n=1 Tax=Mucilaginibacter sp. UR6-1 TaxID=1435643 RepID=UPI001E566C6A|nr:pyrimidine/purine nucleoside phosphorylase [Mucilaginibacter sp. UR6-1]MCC8408001.1 pyrimidine/purine nucleoside phosphorylase [Mucilaginibacter sp. UR6-1]